MAYCTQDDILKMISESELVEITADLGSEVDPDVVAEAIEKADSEINSYCEGRYRSLLPFDPVPGRIQSLSVDLAIYHLFSRRNQSPEERRQRYDDAIAFLRDVSRGKANIPGLTDEALTEAPVMRWYAI